MGDSRDVILSFLYELKNAYTENPNIYMQGSCFRLFKMLKTIWPDSNPYYSQVDGHWITEINNRFYDINGEINKDYVEFKTYKIEGSEVVLASAYIPTYKGQGVSYSKYIKTI